MKDKTARKLKRRLTLQQRAAKAGVPHVLESTRRDVGILHEERSRRIRALEIQVKALEGIAVRLIGK